MIRAGIYKHYKGDLYRVLFMAHESTNGTPLHGKFYVVYVSLKTGRVNVRWEHEFHSMVWASDGGVWREEDLDRVHANPEMRMDPFWAKRLAIGAVRRFVYIGEEVPS